MTTKKSTPAKKSTTAKNAKPKPQTLTSGGHLTLEPIVGEPFVIDYGDEQFELPSLATITFGEMEILSELDLSGGLEQIRVIFEALSPRFAEGLLPRLGPQQLATVVLEWQKASGVSLPKA